MANCLTTIPNTEVINAIREQVGNNLDFINKVYMLCYDGDSYSNDFIAYCKENGINITDTSNSVKDIAFLAMQYKKIKYPDYKDFSQLSSYDTLIGRYGYTSAAARKKSFDDVVHIMIRRKYENEIKVGEKKTDGQKLSKEDALKERKNIFISDILAYWGLMIKKRIKQYAQLPDDRAKEILGNNADGRIEFETLDTIFQNATVQDKNIYACYKEMYSDVESFFDSIFKNPLLGDLRITNDESDEDYEREEGDSEEGSENTEDSRDMSIDQYNSHGGEVSTFTKHINDDIKTYFAQLNKLKSTNKTYKQNKKGQTTVTYDTDTNNLTGIPEGMNVNMCCYQMFLHGDFTDIASMIQSIEDIANYIPGMEAFIQFADELRNDTDFAFKVKYTFDKFVVSKLETITDGDTAQTRLVNRTLDRKTGLRMALLNNIRTTSLNENADTYLDILNSYIEKDENDKSWFDYYNEEKEALKEAYSANMDEDTIKEIEDHISELEAKIIGELSHIIKIYYPTLSDASVVKFLYNHADENGVSFLENIKLLATNIRTTINEGKKALNNYYVNQTSLAEAKRVNKRIRRLIAIKNAKEQNTGDNYVSFPEGTTEQDIKDADKVSQSDYLDLDAYYNYEYVTPALTQAALGVADLFNEYTLVNGSLNTRNVEGNQSSDAINNNLISNIVVKTLNSPEALAKFGAYKTQSRQFDYSNILVEHLDENGNRLNYGLFRQDPVTKQLIPTEYAQDLLKVRLFNGATDSISSKNVLYSKMSKSDYQVTAFLNYFQVERIEFASDDKEHIDTANYFLPIPADAPKNFSIEAPRYNTGHSFENVNALIGYENEQEANEFIDTKYKSIPKLDNIEENNTVDIDSTNTFISLVTEGLGYLRLGYKNKNQKSDVFKVTQSSGTETYVDIALKVKTEDGSTTEATCRVKGNLYIQNGLYSLKNVTCLGIGKASTSVISGIKSIIRNNGIENGDIKQKANKNHATFKALVNAFKQELTNMANTLNTMFENNNGLVRRNGEDPIFKEGFDNTKETARKLYSTYHCNGTILKVNNKKDKTIAESNAQLTGKVFSSDKFTVRKELNGNVTNTNYGKKILDEAFNLLYGGATDSYLHTKPSINGQVDIVLTDEQTEIIEKYINDFIIDYTTNAVKEFKQFEELIPDDLYNRDNIVDFMMNYQITNIWFNDLFGGDTKFYKNTQTWLKRLKEIQGSGNSYGIANYNMNLDMTFDDPNCIVPATINTISFQRTKTDADGNTYKDPLNVYRYNEFLNSNPNMDSEEKETKALEAGSHIYQRQVFRGVTIKNTIKTDKSVGSFETDSKGEFIKNENGAPIFKEIGILSRHLINVFKKINNLNEQEATDKAAKIMSGYTSAIVNDAQSYITFEEWVRRISARGQYPKYKKLIDAILDETKPIDAELYNQFVQVQKNFYYDQYYNKDLKMMCPRQIKNAEFVLVRRFIAGTELETVYDLMQKYDIDQLNTEETSKAGKCNVLTLWNDNGELTDDNLNDFESHVNESCEYYNYNYLYTQQETPQHMDAENKAGIQVMKKMIDNIPSSGHPLSELKNQFFSLYSEKIHRSFESLMEELGVITDENGNLKLDDTEERKIEGLDVNVFLKKCIDEANRLGLDSNQLDYYTRNDGTATVWSMLNTLMPSYMSNVSAKNEHIFQSIFNNNITRQKLPGFHAAQVTNVGFNPINKNNISDYSYSGDLNYHPAVYSDGTKTVSEKEYNEMFKNDPNSIKNFKQEVAAYAEIKVPASVFKFNKKKRVYNAETNEYTEEDKSLDEMLQELKDEGLDTLIGYRIPTEGKQSVCVMKIVGLLDEAQGSTIIVPDAWVPQTGADFDIDSVYTMTYHAKLGADGKLHRIKYRTKEDRDIYSWFNYVKKNTGVEHAGVSDAFDEIKENSKSQTKEIFKERKAAYQEEQKKIKEKLREKESEAFDKLPSYVKKDIIEIHRQAKAASWYDGSVSSYYTMLQAETERLSTLLKRLDGSKPSDKFDATAIRSYRLAIGKIKSNILKDTTHYNEEKENWSKIKSGIIEDAIDEVKKAQLDAYTKDAEENGLMSLEEFENTDPLEFNSNKAIDNAIIDTFVNILSSEHSLQENLARSNFEKIEHAMKILMNPREKALKDFRSPYNIMHSAEMLEDVASVRNLKAFSVVRDTFCSVCNTVRPYIAKEHQFKVVYSSENGYTQSHIIETFGKENVEIIEQGDKKIFIVTHDKFGWSNNNFNVDGGILTSDSSQTTAHILDAVKAGSVPNENEYTFQVYKLFPDVGCDYETTVAFMMQDGISRITNHYTRTKSIYAKAFGNPIYEALKEASMELLKLDGRPAPDNTPIKTLIELLQEYNSEIARLFNAKKSNFKVSLDNKEIGKLLISSSRMKDVIDAKGEFANKRTRLLFEIGTILQYHKLNKLGEAVANYARVCNPDKFGAKQSIFATNKVFNDLTELINEDKPVLIVPTEITQENEEGKEETSTQNIHFLSTIYPGFNGNLDSYISSTNNKSSYPSLHYFLKYASGSSIKINRMLFETQSPAFINGIMSLENTFSNGIKMTEKTYKNFEKYVLSIIYNEVPEIANSFEYDYNKNAFVFKKDSNIEEERRRIYGYNYRPDLKVRQGEDLINFEVKDITNPTEEEMRSFQQFTPAQKVLWIQQHFADAGVFNALNATLYSKRVYNKNKLSSHTITYNEDTNDAETIYDQFLHCFRSDNPLLKSATIDLIKYSFIVEGFRMKKNAVNKVINNKVLYLPISEGGLDIISQINSAVNNMTTYGSSMNPGEKTDTIRENFIRSHPNLTEIPTRFEKRKGKVGELEEYRKGQMIFLNTEDDTQAELALRYNFNYKKADKDEANTYVKLQHNVKGNTETTLYKIEEHFLSTSETGTAKYIVAIPINMLEENESSTWSVNPEYRKYQSIGLYHDIIEKLTQTSLNQYHDVHNAAVTEANGKYQAPPIAGLNGKYADTFDINDPKSLHRGDFDHVIDMIEKYKNESLDGKVYVRSMGLASHIPYGTMSNPQDINGTKYVFTRVNTYNFDRAYADLEKNAKKIAKYKQSIKDIYENTNTAVTNVFLAQPYIQSVREEDTKIELSDENTSYDEYEFTSFDSSVNEINKVSYETIYTNMLNEDAYAKQAYYDMKNNGVSLSGNSIELNAKDIAVTTAEYVHNKVNKLISDLNYFKRDDLSGEIYSVDSQYVMNLIRVNPAERQRYLKLILEVDALLKNYGIVNNIEISSKEENLKSYYDSIRNDLDKLRRDPLTNKAYNNFAEDYLKGLSNDPRIRENMMSVLNAYNSTGSFESWINDTQESTNPLIQIVTREVMTDIREQDMIAERRVRDFNTMIKNLKAKAKAAGKDINWNHIIDKYGRFIQNYNQEFLDDLNNLRDTVRTAKEKWLSAPEDKQAEFAREYLEARLNFDKWKLNHVNQELNDDYYATKIGLDEKLLTEHPDIFCEYETLRHKRTQLYNKLRNNVVDDETSKEIQDISYKLRQLTSLFLDTTDPYIRDEKPMYENSPFTGRNRAINCVEAAIGLSDYIKQLRELNSKYYTDDFKYGFEEELEKCLDVISNYEERDNNGHLIRPVTELMKIPEYVRAKEWLAENAIYKVKDEAKAVLNEALNTLRKKNSDEKRTSVLYKIAEKHNAIDYKGDIDATQFTDEEIEQIKKEQLVNYNIRENTAFNDRWLISNAPENNVIFKEEFYKPMHSNDADNAAYLELLTAINSLLEKYYDTETKRVRTYDMTIEELIKLKELYINLSNTKRHSDKSEGKRIGKYIEENAQLIINNDAFNEDLLRASERGENYKRIWIDTCMTDIEDSEGDISYEVNRYLYGYLAPKGYKADGTGDNSLVDTKRQKALETINKCTRVDKSEYYYKKYREMREKSDEVFNKWWTANHVYNPYTHEYQPLSCWMHREIMTIEDDEVVPAGEWIPNVSQRNRRVKNGKDKYGNPDNSEDMTNPDYKKGSLQTNYKAEGPMLYDFGDNPYDDNKSYKNDSIANEFEEELRNECEKLIQTLTKSSSAKKFVEKGFAPLQAKHKEETGGKFVWNAFKEFIGAVETADGTSAYLQDKEIDYSRHRPTVAPMMQYLKNAESKLVRPEGMSDEEYERKRKEHELEVQSNLIDRNWEDVFANYIKQTIHYNAIQDNVNLMYYAKNMISKNEVFVQNLGFNNFQKSGIKDEEGKSKYITKQDDDLVAQYSNWIRRLVYDQYKKPNNKITKFANMLQTYNSAKFMMLNITGGVANVTVGRSQMLAEKYAKEYFGDKFGEAQRTYLAHIPSFLRDMYNDKASSLPSAFIKFFQVVDYDEVTGQVTNITKEEWIKRIKDFMYSPQAMGEHYMQNSAMFAMLKSHKLIPNPDYKDNGKTSYEAMTESEYVRRREENCMNLILSPQKLRIWNKFKEYELSDPNSAKEYMWFRKNLATEFANLYMTQEEKEEFIKKSRDIREKAKKEFNSSSYKSLWENCELQDGYLGFKENSILSKLPEDEAYKILAQFKGRVISVNKKIHGIYDKLGAARIESEWWGGIVMQYHKHIYPGFMKRYRRKGYFNEERGTIEKGYYWSFVDFLALPLHKKQFADKLKADTDMTDEELTNIQGIQNLFKGYIDFLVHIKTNWNLLPESERSNIKRCLGEIRSTLAWMAVAMAIYASGADDEPIAQFLLHIADRTISEEAVYGIGIVSESKKLWSSPVAVQGAISDTIHTIGLLAEYIANGEDFNPYYTSGLYAGELKIDVMIERNIPILHSYNMLKRIQRNNSYYKLGENMLSIIPVKKVGKWMGRILR